MQMTLKQIEEKLETIIDPADPFLSQCRLDERKGVHRLLGKWEKKYRLEMEERNRLRNLCRYEQEARNKGYRLIAGIDEAGRGPLAGPVVAAAVIFPEEALPFGVDDSKKLSAKKREIVYENILSQALSIGIGIVHADEIDNLDIFRAAKKAMNQAVNELTVLPDLLLIDAMEIEAPVPQLKLIKGDAKSISIAGASIVAKVTRDRLMKKYAKQFPQYYFDANMGYGTKDHIEALHRYGPCPIHRKTFAPVKDLVDFHKE